MGAPLTLSLSRKLALASLHFRVVALASERDWERGRWSARRASLGTAVEATALRSLSCSRGGTPLKPQLAPSPMGRGLG